MVKSVWIEWGPNRDQFAAFPPRPCWQCGKPTPWLEVNFEAPTCIGCVDGAWIAYNAAERAAGPVVF